MSEKVKIDPVEASGVQKTAFKVTRRVLGKKSFRPGKIYDQPIDENSFGLPARISCPGKTPICDSVCYAQKIELWPGADAKIKRNWEKLQNKSVEEMIDLINPMIVNYSKQAKKLDIPEDSHNFRLHWDGDFFSTDYAKAWREVIQQNPEVVFWTYTRSFLPNVNVVPILADIKNLNLFMSVDSDNVGQAAIVAAENPGVRVAYLVEYGDDAPELIEQMGDREDYRAFACPENIEKDNGKRRIPLVTEEKGGACQNCRYCIKDWDKRDLILLIEKRLIRPVELPFEEELEPKLWLPQERYERRVQPIGEAALTHLQCEFDLSY